MAVAYSGADTVATLDGLFKVQYAPDLNDLIPQFAILNRDIKYVPADKQNGKYYSVPCVLRSNQGVTYLGSAGTVSPLLTPINAVMQEAQVYGSELNIRGQLSYKALSQAASAGARAFKKASSWLVEDMTNVSYTRLELSALHGQLGLGVVASNTVAGAGQCNIVISEAEWAAGIWVVLEGARFEAWSSVGAGAANRGCVIQLVGVDSATRTLSFVTVSGNETLIVPGDVLFPEGARESGGVAASDFNEMAGLFKQYSPATTALFGITRTGYSLLQGNVYDLNSTQLTSARVVEAASLALDKGLMSDATLLVGTKTFADLNAENMGLRMYDSSFSAAKAENGTKEIVYDHVNGKIKVICHPFVKGGQALLFSMDDVLMVGSSRPTFEIPGMQDRFFRLVDGSNAVEMQNYCDLAIFAHKPGQGVVLTGITHSDS
jgi:hypothetical protein